MTSKKRIISSVVFDEQPAAETPRSKDGEPLTDKVTTSMSTDAGYETRDTLSTQGGTDSDNSSSNGTEFDLFKSYSTYSTNKVELHTTKRSEVVRFASVNENSLTPQELASIQRLKRNNDLRVSLQLPVVEHEVEAEAAVPSQVLDENKNKEAPTPEEELAQLKFAAAALGGGESSKAPEAEKKKPTIQVAQSTQVFFMIGCQRSGSNWLRTMLSEREDLIAPHPPHIMRDFMPKLDEYGDLSDQRNLKILIDHVCAFVERNQVQWLDLHSRPMKFNRQVMLMEVMVTISCFTFKEKYTSQLEGRDFDGRIENKYYLLSIFDAVMNLYAKANGKKIWMCKSMGMSQFHDILLSFYGTERLRYIYLVRDPRDVCNSFMRTPVGDCHPYNITKKWAKLQNAAARIVHETPTLLHQVCYEEVLGNKEAQVKKIVDFMGARDVCRSMRRGSIVAIKSEGDMGRSAKMGRESKSARHLSYQFKNLSRGDSFTKGQFEKYKKEMTPENILLVESVAYDEMVRLGYEPQVEEENCIEFTDELVEEYNAENKQLIRQMNDELAIENPDDLKRRQVQAAVLKKTTSEHFDEEFIKSPTIDIDEALDQIESVKNDKGFLTKGSIGLKKFDFKAWPLKASQVGFVTTSIVKKRLEVEDTQTLKLKDFGQITFASASQGGYYPNDKDKANQDAFISGAQVSGIKKEDNGILFAVFDGHGPNGHTCARKARDHVTEQFVEGMMLDNSARELSTIHDTVGTSIASAYRRTSLRLESGEFGVDASHSGTTAVSLFVTKDFLHTANVGDSRCLLITDDEDGKPLVKSLTVDHSPDREDEIKRIEAAGGVVMTSDQYDAGTDTFTSFEQKRIWSKDGKWPGTAFTRSIGDAVAKDLGVTSDPECNSITTQNGTFVLGSDGIFDFITDDEIGEVVKRNASDPQLSCRELVGMAWNRWCVSEERADDITIIVGHIKRSKGGSMKKLRHRLLKGRNKQ